MDDNKAIYQAAEIIKGEGSLPFQQRRFMVWEQMPLILLLWLESLRSREGPISTR